MKDDAYRNRSAEKREAKFNYQDLDDKELVHKTKNDVARVYKDGEQFELYSVFDGLMTAVLGKDEAVERANEYDRYQDEGNPGVDISKDSSLDK